LLSASGSFIAVQIKQRYIMMQETNPEVNPGVTPEGENGEEATEEQTPEGEQPAV